MKATGGNYSAHEHGGSCGVCGSVNAIYTVLFYHAKTNTYVRMGQDCATKCEIGNEAAFRAFREGVKDAMDMRAGKNKAKAVLAERGLSAAWDIFDIGLPSHATMESEEVTVRDIVGKLVQYGSLSDAQYEFLGKLLNRIETRPEREAKREAEEAAAKPIPAGGRMEITGVVIATKVQEGPYGSVTKMLVQHVDGWKVWGTRPSLVRDADGNEIFNVKGVTINFAATVEVSKDNPKFGFFKRPTAANEVPAQQPAGPCDHDWGSVEEAHEENRPVVCIKCGICGDV